MIKNIYTFLLLIFLGNFLVAQNLKREISHNTRTWQERGLQLKAATTPFITTWKTDNDGFTNNNQIKIATEGLGYNYSVDWGDGQVEAGFTGDALHTYVEIGTYQVKITGIFPRIVSGGVIENDAPKLISIDQWGDNQWTNMNGAFENCYNMFYKATDVPDLSLAEDLFAMFYGAGSFETSLANWDVSTIIDTYYMFSYTDFNQDISSWNVSNVLNMGEMFIGTPFNQDISLWDVSLVTSMYEMFRFSDFNQPIGNWNVSNVDNMTGMFRDSPFNQDISGWDVRKVIFMGQMFENSNFSYDVGNWQTSSLQEMGGVFYNASNFNHDLGSWNISSVYDLASSLDSSGVNTSNYDKTLRGWASQTVLPDLTFNGTGLTYCASSDDRSVLEGQGWIFNGDEFDCSPLMSYDFIDGDLTNQVNAGTYDLINSGSTSSFNRFGEPDQAYFFDGIDDYFEVEGSQGISSLDQAFSFSGWIRPEGFTADRYPLYSNIIDNYGTWAVYDKQADGTYTLHIRIVEVNKEGRDLFVPNAIVENEWSHIVITCDPDHGIKYYKNNTLIDEAIGTYTAAINSAASNLFVGYEPYFSTHFSGSIDDVRFYDYELGQGNINYNYFVDNGGPFTPHAYYPFDGNYDDASGNFRNPVSTNTPAFTENRFFEANSALNLAQGLTDFLTYDWTFNQNQAFSISVWVNWQGGADFQEIVSWWDAGVTSKAYLGVADNGNIRFGDAYTQTDVPMPVDRWVHLVAVFDLSQSQLYLDNELVATQQGTSYAFGTFRVGSLENQSELWNGAIDDLSIYSRPLNSYLVNDLFKENGFAKKPTSGPSNAKLINGADDFLLFSVDRAQEEVDGYIAVRSAVDFVSEATLVDGTEYADFEYLSTADAYVVNTNQIDTLFYDYDATNPLAPNTTYYYRVWAYNGDGISRKYSNANTVTFSDFTTAADPTDYATNIQLVGSSSSSVSGSFSPGTNVNIEGYLVMWAEEYVNGEIPTYSGFFNKAEYNVGQKLGNFTISSISNSANFEITGLGSEKRYVILVTTFTGTGLSSNYAFSTISRDCFTLDKEASSSPASVNASASTENSISMEWEDVLTNTNQETEKTLYFDKGNGSIIDFIGFQSNDYPNFELTQGPFKNDNEIEIRFGNGLSQKAHRFLVPVDRTTGVADNEYSFQNYVDVPFQVWDKARNIQLNVSFRDQDRNGAFSLINRNLVGDALTQSREYVYISDTEYNANSVSTEMAVQGGQAFRNMYLIVPVLSEGATWSPNSLPRFNLKIGTYSLNQENYLVVRNQAETLSQSPIDGKNYLIGDKIGDGTVVYFGESAAIEDLNLPNATQYYYHIHSVAGDGPFSNHRTVDPLVVDASTLSQEPSTQATGLSFQNISFTSIDIGFNTNQDNSTGYLVVSRNGSEVDFVPQDGVTYQVEDLVGTNDDQLVLSNSSATSVTHINLSPGDTYYYKVYSFNGNGVTTNYLFDSPLGGNQETLVDTSAPIQGTPSYSQTAEVGAEVEVSITVTDAESGVADVSILYLTSDVGDYTKAATANMQASGDTYRFVLPQLTVKGLEFKIVASNGFGSVSESAVGAIRATVTGEGVSIPYSSFGSDQSNYRIISVPFQLTDNSIASVFGSAFGGVDDSKWRMYRYQNGSTTELSASGSLSVGSGYWLIASESVSFNTGAGTTVASSTIQAVKITLKPGWNQIGNPYTFDVPWSLIQAVNDISFKLRVFNGTWTDGVTLKAFSGGFVNNTTSSDIVIEIPTSQSTITNKVEQNVDVLWNLPIKVVSNEMINTFGGIGMKTKGAKVTVSDHDYSLPRLDRYLELNHQDKFNGYPATMSYIENSSTGNWKFMIDNNLNDASLQLQWNPALIANLPNDVYLWDAVKEIAVDMKKLGYYDFNNGISNSFAVFYGDRNFILENTEVHDFRLYDPFPNPSEGKLNLSFNVPASSSNESLLLQIYDSKGGLIKEQTVSNFQPGINMFELNIKSGNLVTSRGIYYVSVLYNNETYLKKIVINN